MELSARPLKRARLMDDTQADDIEEERASHSSDELPSFFRPDLDMVTAIQVLTADAVPRRQVGSIAPLPTVVSSERLDLVPQFYAYTVKSCLFPIRRIQHDLFTLYFRYIHPMFPVVDECHFSDIHYKFKGREELLDPADFAIYQAILAAGFGHLSEGQLQRTFYRTVHLGQEAQFDQVKMRYWSHPPADPIVLTQICLLVSLWSPGPAGAQNNTYWLNRAFNHAAAGELCKARTDDGDQPSRLKLLWWCCLVRDRVLALGMRRPYSLHLAPSEEAPLSPLDFGKEASSPPRADLHAKRMEIRAFIWLCRLSDIMAAMAIFEQRRRFAQSWSGDDMARSLLELEEAAAIESDLKLLQRAFEIDMSSAAQAEDVPTPISILRIVSNSLIAVLYQPYLDLYGLDVLTSVGTGISPLKRMKEQSRAVEASIVNIVRYNKSDTLPNWLVSWVTLPLAVYHVIHNVALEKTPEKVMMPFYTRFMRRTTGAQALFLVLMRATKESAKILNPDGDKPDSPSSEPDKPPQSPRSSSSGSSDGNDANLLEAKMLSHVTKALDYALEANC